MGALPLIAANVLVTGLAIWSSFARPATELARRTAAGGPGRARSGIEAADHRIQ
jgi:hypothetical protein